MKAKDVEIGAQYIAKASGELTRVRIESESPFGGWNAVNVPTGRVIRIRSARRLRYRFQVPAETLPLDETRDDLDGPLLAKEIQRALRTK